MTQEGEVLDGVKSVQDQSRNVVSKMGGIPSEMKMDVRLKTRASPMQQTPDPCFVLMPKKGEMARVKEGVLVFSSSELAKKYLKNFESKEKLSIVSHTLKALIRANRGPNNKMTYKNLVVDYVEKGTKRHVVPMGHVRDVVEEDTDDVC